MTHETRQKAKSGCDDSIMPHDPVNTHATDRAGIPEVERHLLSCCLWGGPNDPGIDDAAEVVTPTDFILAAHGAVFAAALERRRECGTVLPEDVADLLAKRAASDQQLAAVLGDLGADLVSWLIETQRTLEPYGGHARILARLVREASLFRQLRSVAAEISRHAVMPTGPAAEVFGQCERLLFDLADTSAGANTLHSAADMMRAAGHRVDLRQSNGGRLGGLSCGYPDLDELLGGLRPGQMVVVGARPGGGKTAMGLNIAAKVANGGIPVMFFSLEMPEDQIADRLLSMGSGVPMSKLTKGRPLTAHETDRVFGAAGPDWIGGAGFHCDDASDQSAQRMTAVLRRAVRRHGIGLGVVDYLQLIRAENPKDNRTQQVGTAARRVKQMARECGVPVLCLCQLNREVENRAGGRPKLSDLRESGEIEQHADMVLLLHREANLSNDDPIWPVEVIVAKNRNGPIGDVPLMYKRATMTFENSAARSARGAA